MGTLRPGDWNRVHVPKSPDEYKKLQSGFWKHEYRVDSAEDIWRCDLPKLHEAVRNILMDQRESRLFYENPHRYLDTRFGLDTAKVYFSKHPVNNRYVDMRVNPFLRDDMAYWTGTTTNTTTTTAGTSDTFWIQDNTFIRNELDNQMKRSIKKATNKVSFKRKRVKTFPFKASKYTSLLDQLQQEFDHWAGKELELLTA